MLPSMPILFTRESQDGFGSKIEPSTSFFGQSLPDKPIINPVPVPSTSGPEPPKLKSKEVKGKALAKKQEPISQETTKLKENPLDTALVRSFYTKVQSKFSSPVPTNKFNQFQNILKTFDPVKETPVDLYKKIENLFGENHKEIVEDFLLFLKPGQAAQVGRATDYFILMQMTNFIELLKSTFARKPTVLRKVLRALSTGLNSGNMEEVKNRVSPHLRSNPRLADLFKSLFPDERPPDSVYENGTDMLGEDFLTADKSYEVWKFEEASNNKRNLEAKERLDSVYLHGRVFLQHGRMLRSARVTYPYSKEPYRVHARRLAPDHLHLSPPPSDDERASPKRQNKSTTKPPPKRPKKQIKSPTKTIKDVNDNTNKECVTNSPKTVRKQSVAKNKNLKDKSEILKKDKKDNKNNSTIKKEETKAKLLKLETDAEAKPNLESACKISKLETEVASKQTVVITQKEPDPELVQEKAVDVKSNWTRDEDKTMLQVLKGQAGSEQVFCKISELLPHRSATEIKERFIHVMTLLQQMAVGEVT